MDTLCCRKTFRYLPVANEVAVSVVVPFYNESGSVELLHRQLSEVMHTCGLEYELVYINDGSNDDTIHLLNRIAQREKCVVVLDLKRNFGQTAALQAGFDYARGNVVLAMDGDLQHDPSDIPNFLARINEGYDLVSGWRHHRRDFALTRRLPSRIANWFLAMVSGCDLHDFGTTFKAYRRELLQSIRLYGDMHRFIPALCAIKGAKICEIPINNPSRVFGKSNYGISRTFRVALDILALRFLTKYMTRPLHYFGKYGVICGACGITILFYCLVRKLFNWQHISIMQTHGPLLAMGFFLVLTCMMMLALGLLGEMLMRIYFESTDTKTYVINRHIKHNNDAVRFANETGRVKE